MSKPMNFLGSIMKNLFSPPVTSKFPFEPAVYPERTRGHVEIDINKCILCSICAKKCPPRAIKLDKAGGTWTINRFDCVQCGYCVESCPKSALSIIPGYQTPGPEKVEAVYNVPVKPKAPKEDKKADAPKEEKKAEA